MEKIPGKGAMNTRTTQPVNPQNIQDLNGVKKYLFNLHSDQYPEVQSLPQNVPTISNLTNGTVTGGNVRQGREWTISYTINPTISGNSVASGASLTLPFAAALTSLLFVTFGTTILPAKVTQGSSTLVLPNWSTPLEVLIYGKAVE